MIDTFKHKGLRKKLVEEISRKGIKNQDVLNAIDTLPRHYFFKNVGVTDLAYVDNAFPIAAGQTISQPYTVAFQTELLEIKKRDKVLEIGTGSGYQACILALLGAKVYSIERQKELFVQTSTLIKELKYRIDLFYGDGFKGLPNYGPFDKILLTAAPPELPVALLQQLKVGGFLVAPIGDENKSQIMTRIVKKSESEYSKEEYGKFGFVPMLKGTADK